jgi:hypothetical protein
MLTYADVNRCLTRSLVRSALLVLRRRSSSRCAAAYVSIRQHTSAYVSIRQHTSAYVSIRQHEEEELEQVCSSIVAVVDDAVLLALAQHADIC